MTSSKTDAIPHVGKRFPTMSLRTETQRNIERDTREIEKIIGENIDAFFSSVLNPAIKKQVHSPQLNIYTPSRTERRRGIDDIASYGIKTGITVSAQTHLKNEDETRQLPGRAFFINLNLERIVEMSQDLRIPLTDLMVIFYAHELAHRIHHEGKLRPHNHLIRFGLNPNTIGEDVSLKFKAIEEDEADYFSGIFTGWLYARVGKSLHQNTLTHLPQLFAKIGARESRSHEGHNTRAERLKLFSEGLGAKNPAEELSLIFERRARHYLP